jgi:hypothetical protein
MPALRLVSRSKEVGLIAELLFEAFRLFVDFGLFATTLFLFSLSLLLFLFEEL